MGNITRKGISFEPEQLEAFDKLIGEKGYANRSEAIRDLIRNFLIEEQKADPETKMIGTLTILYDHHAHDVQHNLTHLQHGSPELIISSMHTHMDHDNCLEVIVLKGKVKEINQLSDRILAAKGIKHGKLVLTNIPFKRK